MYCFHIPSSADKWPWHKDFPASGNCKDGKLSTLHWPLWMSGCFPAQWAQTSFVCFMPWLAAIYLFSVVLDLKNRKVITIIFFAQINFFSSWYSLGHLCHSDFLASGGFAVPSLTPAAPLSVFVFFFTLHNPFSLFPLNCTTSLTLPGSFHLSLQNKFCGRVPRRV